MSVNGPNSWAGPGFYPWSLRGTCASVCPDQTAQEARSTLDHSSVARQVTLALEDSTDKEGRGILCWSVKSLNPDIFSMKVSESSRWDLASSHTWGDLAHPGRKSSEGAVSGCGEVEPAVAASLQKAARLWRRTPWPPNPGAGWVGTTCLSK